MKKKFPNGYIVVTVVPSQELMNHESVNDVMQEKKEVTIIGSSVHYSHRNNLKGTLAQSVANYQDLLSLQKSELLEFDHGIGTVVQNLCNLTRNGTHAVALYRPEHALMTQARAADSVIPEGLGYTSNTGGVLDLISGVEFKNAVILDNFFENPTTCAQFEEKGYRKENLMQAYSLNYAAGRELITNKLENGVNQNIAFALGCNKVVNDRAMEGFETFAKNLGGNPEISGDRASADLARIIELTMPIREHTNAIRDSIKPGTVAATNFNFTENQMLSTARNVFTMVKSRGGDFDQKAKEAFFATEPTQTLEEASNYGKQEQNFGKLDKAPPTFVSPKIYIENYPK